MVKLVNATIEKIPGLEALVEKISETLTLFILSLLAPYIRPIINAVSAQLKAGSGGVIDASGRHQYEPWTDPHCSDPTRTYILKLILPYWQQYPVVEDVSGARKTFYSQDWSYDFIHYLGKAMLTPKFP